MESNNVKLIKDNDVADTSTALLVDVENRIA